MRFHPCFKAASVVLSAGLLACAGAPSDELSREPAPGFRYEAQNETVRSVLPTSSGALALREPTGGALTEHWVARSLAWFDEAGALLAELRATDDELFVDAVTHPSGEATLFVVDRRGCSLRRYSSSGTLLGSTPVSDPDLATDPTDTSAEPVIPWNVGGCQPTEIRESGRLAADGEHVYLVNRGGSSGTLLFRYVHERGTFTSALRVALFPRHAAPLPTGIVASHRVLHSTHWSYVPRVAVDDAGQARVLLVFGGGTSHDVYNRFAPAPVSDTAAAVVLTIDRGGAVVGSLELARGLAWPGHVAEIEGMRWLRGGVVLVGRVAPAPLPEDGRGWNGFLVRWLDESPQAQLAASQDIDGGDAFSDVAAVDQGWVVAGRSGYWQNPRGASISEEARSEVLVLDSSGSVRQRLEIPQGLRHNAALSIAQSRAGSHLFVGGLMNGPGSHSADGNPALLRADGWLQRITW